MKESAPSGHVIDPPTAIPITDANPVQNGAVAKIDLHR